MNSLYNELHVVIVQPNSNDEKVCHFRVAVDSDNSLHSGKEFTIRLTDDNDPTFYYSLILNEEDFVTLKNQQGLRVDFDNFPKQFGKLLNDCKAREGQFRLVLSDSEIDEVTYKPRAGCYLKVVESNDFKYLCHLSLRIAPGSENDIRRHLCSQLNSIQQEFLKIKACKEKISIENEKYFRDIQDKDKKITELEFRLAEERTSALLELSQQLGTEKEKQSCERTELEVRHQKVLQELNSNIAILTHRNEVLCKEKCSLESDLRIIKLKNETNEKEMDRVISQNSEFKETINNLEEKIKSSEHHFANVQRRLVTSEEMRHEISGALSQIQRELESMRDREKLLTSNLTQCERRLQSTIAQLAKATQRVTFLENDLTAKNHQRENLLTIIKMLEKELKCSKDEILEKSKVLQELEDADEIKTEELKDIKEKLNLLEKQVKEQEITIQRQIDVNSCLHRKLNERDVTNHNSLASDASQRESTLKPHLSRSLPPWRTGSSSVLGVSSSTTLDNTGSQESRKTVLDPSYLIPAENESRKSEGLKSSYFPSKK